MHDVFAHPRGIRGDVEARGGAWVGRSVDQSVGRSMVRLVARSVGRSVSGPAGGGLVGLHGRSVGRRLDGAQGIKVARPPGPYARRFCPSAWHPRRRRGAGHGSASRSIDRLVGQSFGRSFVFSAGRSIGRSAGCGGSAGNGESGNSGIPEFRNFGIWKSQ